jgi:hypothetical protein
VTLLNISNFCWKTHCFGGTNFILRIKEQETRLTLHEHDDDDDDDPLFLLKASSCNNICAFTSIGASLAKNSQTDE